MMLSAGIRISDLTPELLPSYGYGSSITAHYTPTPASALSVTFSVHMSSLCDGQKKPLDVGASLVFMFTIFDNLQYLATSYTLTIVVPFCVLNTIDFIIEGKNLLIHTR